MAQRVKPLAIDLYCGLGGWAEGLLAEGYRVVGFDNERHRYPARAVPESDGTKTGGDWSAYGKPGYVAMGFNVENEKRVKASPLTGGWTEYPGDLVLQDVLTLHGSQFKDATLILASPPCQNYSYLAMPWSRSKDPNNSKAAKALRLKWETEGPDNRLFDACFRIQREAIEATACLACGLSSFDHRNTCVSCNMEVDPAIVRRYGECPVCHDDFPMVINLSCGEFKPHYIPLIVENVRGAQPWVGRSAWNYGSFHLWGDVPALMPINLKRGRKVAGFRFDGSGGSFQTASVNATEKGAWDNHERGKLRCDDSLQFGDGQKVPVYSDPRRNGGKGVHLTSPQENAGGTKIGGDWFSDPQSTCRKHGSRSNARKMASAMIAKIPFELARHIAATYHPRTLPNKPEVV